LVEKKVIDSPPAAPSFLGRQACFTGDEEPPAWLCVVDLVTNKKVRIVRKQVLQQCLRVIRLLAHRDKLAIILDQENLSAHSDTS